MSIQRIRLAKGLTSREVGRRCSLGVNTAARLEDRGAGTIDTFVRVAEALDLGDALQSFFIEVTLRALGAFVEPLQSSEIQRPRPGDLEDRVQQLHTSLASAMKACRVARHLWQAEAGLQSGVDVRTVWNIESQRAGNMRSFVRLCETFGIAADLQRLVADRARSEAIVITRANRQLKNLLSVANEQL